MGRTDGRIEIAYWCEEIQASVFFLLVSFLVWLSERVRVRVAWFCLCWVRGLEVGILVFVCVCSCALLIDRSLYCLFIHFSVCVPPVYVQP
jgi:hypothetical protein